MLPTVPKTLTTTTVQKNKETTLVVTTNAGQSQTCSAGTSLNQEESFLSISAQFILLASRGPQLTCFQVIWLIHTAAPKIDRTLVSLLP